MVDVTKVVSWKDGDSGGGRETAKWIVVASDDTGN